MRAAIALILICAFTGCVRVEENVRTERGQLLRTFERPEVLEGGVRAAVVAPWPALDVFVQGFDTCRTLTVEEYAEEKITERKSGAAGPAISAGVVGTLTGIVLLAISPLVSGEPNKTLIDGGGNYGPSTRQQVTGWSIVGFGVGVPAIAVGIISLLRQGEDVETRKAEQIASQKDLECNARAVDGPVDLVGEKGAAVLSRPAVAGRVRFEASDFKTAELEQVVFFGRAAELDDASRAALDRFSACMTLELDPAPDLKTLDRDALLFRIERTRACRFLRGEALADAARALDDEAERRRAPQE